MLHLNIIKVKTPEEMGKAAAFSFSMGSTMGK